MFLDLFRRSALVVGGSVALLLAGCSDSSSGPAGVNDSGGTPRDDAGRGRGDGGSAVEDGGQTGSDGTISNDDGAVLGDGPAPDNGTKGTPDPTTGGKCVVECRSLRAYHCGYFDTADPGRCRDCGDDSHCAANPDSFGPTCQNNLCTCDGESACAAHPGGTKCKDVGGNVKNCGCDAQADCPADRLCYGGIFARCRLKCQQDSDCDDKEVCDKPTGVCCHAQTGCPEPKQ